MRRNVCHAVYHLLEVMRLREKINDGRIIASTRNSDSRLHKTTNKNTSWTLNIRQKHTERHGSRCCYRLKKVDRAIGDTCCNRRLRFANEAASERWGVPASSNLTRFWGRLLSPSPVRLPIPPRLGQRAFWVSVKFLTSLLRNTWVFMSSLWRLIWSVVSLFGSSFANNLDLDGTRVYAVVTRSFAASPLISSCWC